MPVGIRKPGSQQIREIVRGRTFGDFQDRRRISPVGDRIETEFGLLQLFCLEGDILGNVSFYFQLIEIDKRNDRLGSFHLLVFLDKHFPDISVERCNQPGVVQFVGRCLKSGLGGGIFSLGFLICTGRYIVFFI